ncbi:MAG: methyltransferase domain-containing protein [Pseudomonadota bacterium]
MKSQILDFLICPACLPSERKLTCRIEESAGDELFSGSLVCTHCGTKYPIIDGIGVLLPHPQEEIHNAQAKYESPALVTSYLWSHYADLWEDDDANHSYREWSALLRNQNGISLDAGCAVGRFTFEMGRISDFSIGIDRSYAFIETARRLMKERRIRISLPMEGLITEARTVSLPEGWNTLNVEFLVGDAQALPFRSHQFSSLTSLNLVDKVPQPILHLKEINRTAREKGVQFLFSDPFSWSSEIAEEKNWLGGTPKGPHAGRGLENIANLLTGEKEGFEPKWRVDKRGQLWWKIRNHQNHFELIRSCFIQASR